MYEVTYIINGVTMKSRIPSTDYNQVFSVITNMYGKDIQIINIVRI